MDGKTFTHHFVKVSLKKFLRRAIVSFWSLRTLALIHHSSVSALTSCGLESAWNCTAAWREEKYYITAARRRFRESDQIRPLKCILHVSLTPSLPGRSAINLMKDCFFVISCFTALLRPSLSHVAAGLK